MGSMYTTEYLATTADPATRYTVGTFLAYELHGEAKRWAARYARALIRDLERLEAAGEVEQCRSVRGGVAWRRRLNGETPA